METRRGFIRKTSLGISGIIAAEAAPAFTQNMKMFKIGQLGLGSHGFALPFINPPVKLKDTIRCAPYAVWDDAPGIAEKMVSSMGFKKAVQSPEALVRESDCIIVEHADFRKVLDISRPALEAGKPVFYDRPFTGSVADAEEIVRLAESHDAPLMAGSSLELQPVIPDIQKFARENGPVRAYEAYCPEPFFSWMFPHVINFAHAALGGGIESAYFAGDFILEVDNVSIVKDKFVNPNRPYGSAVSVLTYKPRNGEPPIIGMNHIGAAPGSYHLAVYAYNESRMFVAGEALNAPNIFEPMFITLNDFFVNRKPPRPYNAILEQHRAHVATFISKEKGSAIRLESLKPEDSLPYSDTFRDFSKKSFIQ